MTPAPFGPLGIARTTDTRAIRRAYAQALKRIDQGTQQAEFEALRAAYEAALAWARTHQDDNQRSAAADIPQAPSAPAPNPGPGRTNAHGTPRAPSPGSPSFRGSVPPSRPAEPDAEEAPPGPAPDAAPHTPAPHAADDGQAPDARAEDDPPQAGNARHDDSAWKQAHSRRRDDTAQARADAIAAWNWATRLMGTEDAALAAAWQSLEADPEMQSLSAAHALERALSYQIQHAPNGQLALYRLAAKRFGWGTAQGTQAPALADNIAAEAMLLENLEPLARDRHEQTLNVLEMTPRPSAFKALRWGMRVSALRQQLPWHQVLRTPAANDAAWRARMARMPAWAYKGWLILRSLRWVIYFLVLAKALHLAFLLGANTSETRPGPRPAAQSATGAAASNDAHEATKGVYPMFKLEGHPNGGEVYVAVLPSKQSVRVVLPRVDVRGVGQGPADILIQVLPNREVDAILRASSGSFALDTAALAAARQARVEGPMPPEGFTTRVLLQGPKQGVQRAS